MNNKMKKNKALRAAGGLFVATMLTTSMVSGTYAKYVTQGKGEDSARVARFGVEVNAEGELFSDTYYSKTGSSKPDVDDTITVKSSDETKVVAPGTNGGDGLMLSVTGTPEVAVRVNVTANYIKDGEKDRDIFLAGGNYYTDVTHEGKSFKLDETYYPVKWTLKKDGSDVDGYTKVDLKKINSYFTDPSNKAFYEFGPNENLADDFKYSLTWEWAFGDETGITGNDYADTVLGDLAAKPDMVKKGEEADRVEDPLEPKVDYSTDIGVEFTITVTQID